MNALKTMKHSVFGEVTTMGDTDPEEVRNRQRAAEIGAKDTYPGAGNSQTMQIAPYDPCCFWAGNVFSAYAGDPRARKPLLFASVNGITYANFFNEADLADTMRFYGVSKAWLDPSHPESAATKSGFSLARAGNVLVPYRSIKMAYPGDVMVWEVPKFYSKLGMDNSAPHSRKGEPREKLGIQIVPLDFRELHFTTELVFGELMANHGRDSVYRRFGHRDLRAGRSKNLPKRRRAAVGLKLHTVTAGVRTAETMESRSMAEIITPERDQRKNALWKFLATALPGTDVEGAIRGYSNIGAPTTNADSIDGQKIAAYNELLTAFATLKAELAAVQPTDVTLATPSNDVYTEHVLGVRGFGGGMASQDERTTETHTYFKHGYHLRNHTGARLTEAQVQTVLAEQKRATLFLAVKTGAAGNDEAPAVVSDLLHTVNWGLQTHDDPSTANKYAPFPYDASVESAGTADSALAAMQQQAMRGGVGGFGGPAKRHTDVASEYVRNARDHSTIYARTMAEARESLGRRIVGRSLTVGKPGDNSFVEVLLQGAGAGLS